MLKKAIILDEFFSACHSEVRYSVAETAKKKLKRPGQKQKYDSQNLLGPLKALWFASAQICTKKLKTVIREWLI